MHISNHEPVAVERNGRAVPTITAFVCANCSRAGRTPSSTRRPAPDRPDFCWPLPVREVLVPCSGRLQPEHVLKAYESGADVVCVVGCAEDNCHTLEGSSRCARRVEYVRSLLDQIGIGRERLWHYRLPGSAREDMALGVTADADAAAKQQREFLQLRTLEPELFALRKELADRIAELRPSPLHNSQFISVLDYPVQEDDQSED
jgi:F420-non-reducing hydrogenase iron-sulfur subunit